MFHRQTQLIGLKTPQGMSSFKVSAFFEKMQNWGTKQVIPGEISESACFFPGTQLPSFGFLQGSATGTCNAPSSTLEAATGRGKKSSISGGIILGDAGGPHCILQHFEKVQVGSLEARDKARQSG